MFFTILFIISILLCIALLVNNRRQIQQCEKIKRNLQELQEELAKFAESQHFQRISDRLDRMADELKEML